MPRGFGCTCVGLAAGDRLQNGDLAIGGGNGLRGRLQQKPSAGVDGCPDGADLADEFYDHRLCGVLQANAMNSGFDKCVDGLRCRGAGQEDKPTADESGLGLAVASEVAEANNWVITSCAHRLKGASIRVELTFAHQALLADNAFDGTVDYQPETSAF